MNIKSKIRIHYLSKLSRDSLLVGATVVTGLSLYAKYGVWKRRGLLALSHPDASNNPSIYSSWDPNWDKRANTEASVTQDQYTQCKRHILLVRHGQYRLDGKTDAVRSLTDMGRTQAMITGQRLKALNLPGMKMLASTMTRARETAQLIRQTIHNSGIEMDFDPLLEEGAPACPVPPTDNWMPQPSQFFQDGARIETAFRKYFYRADSDQLEDSYDVIVCHANVIRYFVCRALQFPMGGWIRISLANCSLTMITIHPDGLVVVEMLGDHGHIPIDKVTFS